MKGIVITLCIAASLCASPTTYAESFSLDLQQLKSLDLQTKQVEMLSVSPGRLTLGEVREVPGKAYTVRSQPSAQQVTFLHSVGTLLDAGQDFVKLSGPEVHHYYSLYGIKKSLYEIVAKQYEQNKPLIARSAISQQAWIEISKAYFAAKLDFEEMQHFFELVSGFDEQSETLTLKSPLAGALMFSTSLESIVEQDVIARIVPTDAIRLAVNVINKRQQSIAYLTTSEAKCKLEISSIESFSSGLSSLAWSEPLTPDCPFFLGQRLSVTPHYVQQVYTIPRDAVFSINGDQFIFIQSGNKFEAVNISLESALDKNYIVTSAISLVNKQVLISSVSAAQGILLGLGGE